MLPSSIYAYLGAARNTPQDFGSWLIGKVDGGSGDKDGDEDEDVRRWEMEIAERVQPPREEERVESLYP